MKGNEFFVLCLHVCDCFRTEKKIKLKMTQQELAVLVNCFLFVNCARMRKVSIQFLGFIWSLLLNRFQNSCSAPLKRTPDLSVTLGTYLCCSPFPIVFQVPPAKLIDISKGESSRFSQLQTIWTVQHLLLPLNKVCFHIANERKFGLPPFLFVALVSAVLGHVGSDAVQEKHPILLTVPVIEAAHLQGDTGKFQPASWWEKRLELRVLGIWLTLGVTDSLVPDKLQLFQKTVICKLDIFFFFLGGGNIFSFFSNLQFFCMQ